MFIIGNKQQAEKNLDQKFSLLKFNIQSASGAELLTKFVTEEILRTTAGDKGDAAVQRYREKFTFTS